jgi:hypothetical protein
VVRVLGYRTEMYCVSCEVRTEFICYVEESRPPLWSSGQSSWLQMQRSGCGRSVGVVRSRTKATELLLTETRSLASVTVASSVYYKEDEINEGGLGRSYGTH